jgi:hypothetical protein
MSVDLFDLLIKVHDLAETANGNAQIIIKRYRRKPDFSWAANSSSTSERKVQERAVARDHLIYEHASIKRLHESIRRFREGTQPALNLIRRAVALRVQPIFVDDLSYPTAHEAAEALAEEVHNAWQNGGGYYAVEHAPDRFHARNDDDDADAAIEASIEIWRRLRKLRKSNPLPSDLWGLIQQEFEAARNLAEQDAMIPLGNGETSARRRSGSRKRGGEEPPRPR